MRFEYPSCKLLDLDPSVHWLVQLPAEQAVEFRRMIAEHEAQKHMPYIPSIERLGREEGRQEGCCQRNHGANGTYNVPTRVPNPAGVSTVAAAAPGAYRGRLAPSPTGYLHLGHASTFWIAQQRARQHHGTLILRNEDLDISRVRPEFVAAMLADLAWFGLEWAEGPDHGGPFSPYIQSQRLDLYRNAFDRLLAAGHLYPCTCSRLDILQALTAPHDLDDEPLYPGTCRPVSPVTTSAGRALSSGAGPRAAARVNWRFRVTDGEEVAFRDGHHGPQRFVAGTDFGDFVVWRHDDLPAYQLAVVVDDHAMHISEVVRGADLLRSTARQLLLYRALGLTPPDFFHCPLVTDVRGVRLAKRHDALSLRALRAQGLSATEIRSRLASGRLDALPHARLDAQATPSDNLDAICRKTAAPGTND